MITCNVADFVELAVTYKKVKDLEEKYEQLQKDKSVQEKGNYDGWKYKYKKCIFFARPLQKGKIHDFYVLD